MKLDITIQQKDLWTMIYSLHATFHSHCLRKKYILIFYWINQQSKHHNTSTYYVTPCKQIILYKYYILTLNIITKQLKVREKQLLVTTNWVEVSVRCKTVTEVEQCSSCLELIILQMKHEPSNVNKPQRSMGITSNR